jgi:hypothetical protein
MLRLPAVTRFIDRIVEDLISGRCALVLVPNYPILDLRSGIESEIELYGKKPVYLDLKEPTIEDNLSPGDVLCDRFKLPRAGSNESCIQSLLSSNDFLDSIPFLFVTGESLQKLWFDFLSAYQASIVKLSGLDRTPICYVCPSPVSKPNSDSGVAVHRWSGVVTAMDIEYLLTFSSDQDFSLRALVRTRIIQELSGYDWLLADRLSKHSLQELLSPNEILREYSKSVPSICDNDASWESGTMDTFAGGKFIHSAHLASFGKNEEIFQRIWKAQLKVIYPYLEELRLAVSSNYIHSFKRGMHHLSLEEGDRYQPNDIYELEIGHLFKIARKNDGFSSVVTEMLSVMLQARNALAHIKPVSNDLIMQLERDGIREFGNIC